QSFSTKPLSLAVLGGLAMMAAFGKETPAEAQSSKPIFMLVVPFAAGGPSDITARILLKYLGPELGQNTVIENTPGAGGALAAQRVARAPDPENGGIAKNDGFAWGFASNRNWPSYADPRDMKFAGVYSSGPLILAASKSFPGTTYAELMSWLKSSDANAVIGNPGIGSPGGICTVVWLQKEPDFKPAVVTFTGAGPATVALLQGYIKSACLLSADILPRILDGSVKAIGSTGPVRQLPNIPRLDGIDTRVNNGILMAKETSEPRVNELTRALMAAMKNPEFQRDIDALGLVATPLSDDASAQSVRDAHARQFLDQLDQYRRMLPPAQK
ncbi:MAG: tripartite tricarboxylate transporter substrate binding protein, partial [Candidatus Nitrotoga sp.]